MISEGGSFFQENEEAQPWYDSCTQNFSQQQFDWGFGELLESVSWHIYRRCSLGERFLEAPCINSSSKWLHDILSCCLNSVSGEPLCPTKTNNIGLCKIYLISDTGGHGPRGRLWNFSYRSGVTPLHTGVWMVSTLCSTDCATGPATVGFSRVYSSASFILRTALKVLSHSLLSDSSTQLLSHHSLSQYSKILLLNPLRFVTSNLQYAGGQPSGRNSMQDCPRRCCPPAT